MYRVEDKYFCSEQDLRRLQSRLEPVLRPDRNQKEAGGYKITSVYLSSVIAEGMDVIDMVKPLKQ